MVEPNFDKATAEGEPVNQDDVKQQEGDSVGQSVAQKEVAAFEDQYSEE